MVLVLIKIINLKLFLPPHTLPGLLIFLAFPGFVLRKHLAVTWGKWAIDVSNTVWANLKRLAKSNGFYLNYLAAAVWKLHSPSWPELILQSLNVPSRPLQCCFPDL